MEADGRYVVLVSSEGEEIKVPREVASASLLVKSMTEDGDDTDTIPLPKVSSAILKKVVDYCTYHHDNPPEEIPTPLKTSNLAEAIFDAAATVAAGGLLLQFVLQLLQLLQLLWSVVSEWDFEFVNVEQTVLFDLLLAADYLNVPSLLLLTSAKVASMIKGRSPEEIRREFNIVNDFTPEEEAQQQQTAAAATASARRAAAAGTGAAIAAEAVAANEAATGTSSLTFTRTDALSSSSSKHQQQQQAAAAAASSSSRSRSFESAFLRFIIQAYFRTHKDCCGGPLGGPHDAVGAPQGARLQGLLAWGPRCGACALLLKGGRLYEEKETGFVVSIRLLLVTQSL
ncbi:hypothetical protein Emag_004257 [Eimeria magna]